MWPLSPCLPDMCWTSKLKLFLSSMKPTKRLSSTRRPHLSTTTGDDDKDVERAEPDVSVYADMLLLIDALEREDLTGA